MMHLTLAILVSLLSYAAAKEKKVVCYFLSSSLIPTGNENLNPTDIDQTLCTHLIYIGARLGPEGTINVGDPANDLPENGGKGGYNRINQLRNNKHSLKTLINVGFLGANAAEFSRMASNSDYRKAFVSNAVNFIKKYNFNGLELNWQDPTLNGGAEVDKENYVLLLKELREAFDKANFLLTAHVGAHSTIASKAYNVVEVAKYLHFINLITDVYHVQTEPVTASNAPLYAGSWEQGNDLLLNIESTVLYWLSQGAPAEKIIVRVPFYGRSYKLANCGDTRIGAPAAPPDIAGILYYNQICKKQLTEPWIIRFNGEQRVPYTFKGNQWITYENEESVTEKAKFVNKLGLGGVSVWSLNMDDFRGTCGKKYPLLTAVNQVLRKPCILGALEDIWKSILHVFQNYECLNKELDCDSAYALS